MENHSLNNGESFKVENHAILTNNMNFGSNHNSNISAYAKVPSLHNQNVASFAKESNINNRAYGDPPKNMQNSFTPVAQTAPIINQQNSQFPAPQLVSSSHGTTVMSPTVAQSAIFIKSPSPFTSASGAFNSTGPSIHSSPQSFVRPGGTSISANTVTPGYQSPLQSNSNQMSGLPVRPQINSGNTSNFSLEPPSSVIPGYQSSIQPSIPMRPQSNSGSTSTLSPRPPTPVMPGNQSSFQPSIPVRPPIIPGGTSTLSPKPPTPVMPGKQSSFQSSIPVRPQINPGGTSTPSPIPPTSAIPGHQTTFQPSIHVRPQINSGSTSTPSPMSPTSIMPGYQSSFQPSNPVNPQINSGGTSTPSPIPPSFVRPQFNSVGKPFPKPPTSVMPGHHSHFPPNMNQMPIRPQINSGGISNSSTPQNTVSSVSQYNQQINMPIRPPVNQPSPTFKAPVSPNLPPSNSAPTFQNRPPMGPQPSMPKSPNPNFSVTPQIFNSSMPPQSHLTMPNSFIPKPPGTIPFSSTMGYSNPVQTSINTYVPGPKPPFGPPPVNSSAQIPDQVKPLNKYPGYPIQNQPTSRDYLAKQLGGLSVTSDGWNKGWGSVPIDLLQHRCILPPNGVQLVQPSPFEHVANCSPEIMCSTLNKIPESNSVLQKSRLPFGILIHPYKDLEQLPVVTSSTIVRCRSCRTYINPFISFKGERKWECNLCFRLNELPDDFHYDPNTRTYGDPSRRPEVKKATIEYIAPQEYMLRPPQPACYVFVLEATRQAIESGYLEIFSETLMHNLDDLPGDKRTMIAFITFNKSIQYYMLGEDAKTVSILDVGDIENIFIPSPEDLLVNLEECRGLVEELMSNINDTYKNTYFTESCLGAAITAALKLITHVGGRITVMAATLPTLGPGSLESREDPNQRSAKDVANLGPAIDFYRKFALDCSGHQIGVDLFAFGSQYMDLATLTGMSKFSGGFIHYFNGMSVVKNTPNVIEFRNCLERYLTRKIGLEAVMRVRATRGMSISSFHGNFFVRSTDLLSLPNINPDAGFAMQVSLDEPLHNIRYACFQAALLYTSSKGERRIRVHTLCIPVSANIHDVIVSANPVAVTTFLAKLAVDKSLASKMSDAREAVVNSCADSLLAFKNTMSSTPVGITSPEQLQYFPMYCLALLKSVALRYGTCTKLDTRVAAMCDFKSLPTTQLMRIIYPELYPIHDLNTKGALNTYGEEVVPQPRRLHLSAEFLERGGAYLMDAGNIIYIYVRNGVSQTWLSDVLGVPQIAAVPQPYMNLPPLETEMSELTRNFVAYLQGNKSYPVPVLVIKEDSPDRGEFMDKLYEDRSQGSHSYVEFLQYIKSMMK